MVGEKSPLPELCSSRVSRGPPIFSPFFPFPRFFVSFRFDRTKGRGIMGFVERFVTKFVRLIRFDRLFLFFLFVFLGYFGGRGGLLIDHVKG